MKIVIQKLTGARWLKIGGVALALTFCVLTAFLTGGCATRYAITTSRGYTITTRGKPKFDKTKGAWMYTDMDGKPRSIAAGSVTEVQPQSMQSDDKNIPGSSVKTHH